MYICLCNGITDGDIRRVAASGTPSISQVYRALDCAPKCGKCVPVVRQLLDDGPGPAPTAP